MSDTLQDNKSPLLKQLSRAISADELSIIAAGSIVGTQYINESTTYLETNGDGTTTVNGSGGGSRPSIETYSG